MQLWHRPLRSCHLMTFLCGVSSVAKLPDLRICGELFDSHFDLTPFHRHRHPKSVAHTGGTRSPHCMTLPFRHFSRHLCKYAPRSFKTTHWPSTSFSPQNRSFTMSVSQRALAIDTSPPPARWMKETLDRSAFHRTIPVLAARVAPAKAGIILKADVMRR